MKSSRNLPRSCSRSRPGPVFSPPRTILAGEMSRRCYIALYCPGMPLRSRNTLLFYDYHEERQIGASHPALSLSLSLSRKRRFVSSRDPEEVSRRPLPRSPRDVSARQPRLRASPASARATRCSKRTTIAASCSLSTRAHGIRR